MRCSFCKSSHQVSAKQHRQRLSEPGETDPRLPSELVIFKFNASKCCGFAFADQLASDLVRGSPRCVLGNGSSLSDCQVSPS
jgi:hypothetical protein